jgi:hypothetical protein
MQGDRLERAAGAAPKAFTMPVMNSVSEAGRFDQSRQPLGRLLVQDGHELEAPGVVVGVGSAIRSTRLYTMAMCSPFRA